MLKRKVVRLTAPFVLVFVIACGTHNPPQADIAHYSTNLLQQVEVAQRGVISLNDKKLLPEETARKILDGIKNVADNATKLSNALKVYDLAAPGVARSAALRDVSALVNQVNAAFAMAFNLELPADVIAEIQTLIANVNKTILDIQLEIAKGRA